MYHEEDSRNGDHQSAEFVCKGLEGFGFARNGIHPLDPRILRLKLGA